MMIFYALVPAWAQADINAWIEFIKEKDDASKF